MAFPFRSRPSKRVMRDAFRRRRPSPPRRSSSAGSKRDRSTAFGRKVKDAYGGQCAACGLGQRLVEAAHILPVGLEGPDTPRNGIALCPNHHTAFDKHLMWIQPVFHRIKLHHSIHSAAERGDEPCARFIESTRAYASVPDATDFRPAAQYLSSRYESFKAEYLWAES